MKSKYRLQEVLSDTPTHAVYRVSLLEDPKRTRVIKQLKLGQESADAIARFHAEHDCLSELVEVEGVVRCLGCNQIDSSWYLEFDDIQGRDLAQYLADAETSLSLTSKLSLAIRLCRSLGQVHLCGVMHKDLKPANIVWNQASDQVNIIDFGLASRLKKECAVPFEQKLEGTLLYISPEQTGRMNRSVDYRTDIYSLGVALYELFAGRVPFEETDPLTLVHSHMTRVPPAVDAVCPEVPLMVSRVISKMIEKNAEYRYQNAENAARDLERCRDALLKHGEVAEFATAIDDRSIRFQIPQKLYGREQEVATLLHHFHLSCKGESQVMLVAGYSGVGKTALIREVQRPLVAYRGNFIEGKFGQLSRNVPYSALIQAFQGLINRILAQTSEQFELWKQRILKATAPNTNVIVEVMPELELVVGPQPQALQLGTTENANRFRSTFQSFIEVFIAQEHPLALFIDDLQWADSASLDLLKLLTTQRDQALFFVGAFRDNEVDERHPLTTFVNELAQDDAIVNEIILRPLETKDIACLVQETLLCSADKAASLATICANKTDGNPFFLSAFLHHLHSEGVITFSAHSNCWDWDTEVVQRLEVSGNVVELLLGKLKGLAKAQQELIYTAGCVGTVFDARLLARLCKRSIRDTLRALASLVEANFLIHLDSACQLLVYQDEKTIESNTETNLSFKFLHDRVQLAAIELVPSERRLQLNAAIGQELLKEYRNSQDSVSVFQVVDQLNQAIGLLTKPEDQVELAELNLAAGMAANRSIAYSAAVNYLRLGSELLAEHKPWEKHYELIYQLQLNLAQAEHLAGNTQGSEEVSSVLIERARSNPEKATVYAMIVSQKVQLFQIQESLVLGLEALALLGFDLPANPTEDDLGAARARVQAAISERSIDSLLDLPRVREPRFIATHDLIKSLYDASYIGNPMLMMLLVYVATQLSIEHGNHTSSAAHYAWYAALLSSEGQSDALAWGQLANNLVDRYQSMELRAQIVCVIGTVINHPFVPIRETMPLMLEAVDYGKNYGDYNYATYANLHRLNGLWISGASLARIRQEAESALKFAEQINMMQITFHMQIQLEDVLMGETACLHSMNGTRFNEQDFLKEYETQPYIAYDYYIKKTFLLLIGGQYEDGYAMAKMCEEGIGAALFGSNVVPFAKFCLAMATAAWQPLAPKDQQAQLLLDLESQVDAVRHLSALCDENYLHAYQLADAELQRLRGCALESVLQSYDSAIATALAYGQPHYAALAAERGARHLHGLGLARSAETYFELALEQWRQWGAEGKVKQLIQEFPEHTRGTPFAPADRTRVSQAPALATRTISRTRSGGEDLSRALDFRSLMKASQAISHEVELKRLLDRVMSIVIETAGAQRGQLLLPKEGSEELLLQAEGSAEHGVKNVLLGQALTEASPLLVSVVQYAARSRTAVVLGNASAEGNYVNDPYVLREQPKSVLCAPLVNQNHLVGVLYLENNAVHDAFHAERLQTLQVISSQAAISIENALLYRGLEHKVEQRTAELAAKNRDIQAMLSNLKQGICTIQADGSLHSEYSCHLEQIVGRGELAGESLLDLLFLDSELGSDAVARVEATLSISFGQPVFMFHANSHHLVRKLSRRVNGKVRILELDWEPIANEQGDLEKLMLIVRDVTELRAIESEAQRQKDELAMIGEMLKISASSFQTFIRSSQALFQQNRELLLSFDATQSAEKRADTVQVLFRNAHTIKGNARTHNFRRIVDSVHDAEQKYAAYQESTDPQLDVAGLLQELYGVEADLTAYQELYDTNLASRLADASSRQAAFIAELDQGLREFELQEAVDTAGRDRAYIESLRAKLVAFTQRTLAEVAEDIVHALPTMAAELGKPTPKLTIHDGGVRFSSEAIPLISNVLTHCIRNSLNHGIESPAVRLEQNKTEVGAILLQVCERGNGLLLTIQDDGRGLDLRALKETATARRQGIDLSTATDEQVAELIFRSGLSTANDVTSIAGRGVGMDAVRSDIEQRSGKVKVEFTGETSGLGCRPFRLAVELPKAMC